MAHTNDLMLEKLSAKYSTTTLGDGLAALKADEPTFGTAVARDWYVGKLYDLGLEEGTNFADGLHLADLANLFWSQSDPLSVVP